MRIVAGLGGNALLRRGQRPDDATQRENLRTAVHGLAAIADGNELLVVHGNGPQVGLLALESAADPTLTHPYPLDVLVGETQGMIGYLLAGALGPALDDRAVAVLVTRTTVDPADPAFAHPTKFIGPGYDRREAARLATGHGWQLRSDGEQWRRVVASPEPRSVVELPIVRRLLDSGAVVIAGGGGGIPVVRRADGRLEGVEAVVDKDLVAALLAIRLQADALLLLTDVPGVYRDFGGPGAELIAEASARELVALGLPEGSMGPKVDACRRFVAERDGLAAIGALGQAEDVLAHRAGTRVRNVEFR